MTNKKMNYAFCFLFYCPNLCCAFYFLIFIIVLPLFYLMDFILYIYIYILYIILVPFFILSFILFYDMYMFSVKHNVNNVLKDTI